MAAITVQAVKELRDRTGAGMMDCKHALVDCDGDAEKAGRLLRERGAAKAEKRAGRSAKEGRLEAFIVEGQGAALVELNCETDFVARTDDFIWLARQLAEHVYRTNPTPALIGASPLAGQTVTEALTALSAKTGENVQLGSFARFGGAAVGVYRHHDNKGGGVVELTGAAASVEAAREVAQHLYATAPRFRSREEVPAEAVEAERTTLAKLAESEGKTGKALEGFLEGRVRVFFEENCLLDQILVKDLAKPKSERRTVAKLLGSASVARFQRLRVGEA